MTLARRAARRDESEQAIVDALSAVGFYVERLSAEGLPDLLIWRRGGPFLLCEVKTVRPTSEGGSNPHTPAQVAFFEASEGCPRFTARDPSEAVYEAQRLHLAWAQRP